MNNIIEMAEKVEAKTYSAPITRNVIGYSFTYDQLTTFANLVETATLETLTLEQIKRLYVQKGGVLTDLERNLESENALLVEALKDNIECLKRAAYVIDGSRIDDLPKGIISSTCSATSALISARDSEFLLTKLGKE